MTTKTAAQRGTAVSVKSLAITAICLVLVYVFTAVVNIRLPFAPNGGLIHLGNVPLFVAAILFGKRTGMIAGGIGMALSALRLDPVGPLHPGDCRLHGLCGGGGHREEKVLPLLSAGPAAGLRHQDRRILPGRGRDLSKLGGAPHLHPGQFDSGGGRRHHHPGGH